MIELNQIFKRLDPTVPWFQDTLDATHMDYITTNYKDTGKYQGYREELDGFHVKIFHKFTDQAAFDQWIADAYLQEMAAQRDAYNSTNSIELVQREFNGKITED